jgi:hypothetical protein
MGILRCFQQSAHCPNPGDYQERCNNSGESVDQHTVTVVSVVFVWVFVLFDTGDQGFVCRGLTPQARFTPEDRATQTEADDCTGIAYWQRRVVPGGIGLLG